MTKRSQPPGRYSPGCGSRIKARTLASELQGEASVSRAFEGYASPLQYPADAVLARPKAPPSRMGVGTLLRGVMSRVLRWFKAA